MFMEVCALAVISMISTLRGAANTIKLRGRDRQTLDSPVFFIEFVYFLDPDLYSAGDIGLKRE